MTSLATNLQDAAARFGDRPAIYKYPRHVWLAGALPKGPTGTVLTREIVPPEDLA